MVFQPFHVGFFPKAAPTILSTFGLGELDERSLDFAVSAEFAPATIVLENVVFLERIALADSGRGSAVVALKVVRLLS